MRCFIFQYIRNYCMATYLLRVKRMLSWAKQTCHVGIRPLLLSIPSKLWSWGEQSIKSWPLTSADMKPSHTSSSLAGIPLSRCHVSHEPCSLPRLLATSWLPSCTTYLTDRAHQSASLQPLPITTFSSSDPCQGRAAISRHTAPRSIQDAPLAHVTALWWRWECKHSGRTMLCIILNGLNITLEKVQSKSEPAWAGR